MTNFYCPWPYASKPYIQSEFKVDRLVIRITFKYPMDTDVEPAANLFTVKVDGVDKTVAGVNWVDEYTLSFQVTGIPAAPARVLCTYAGPSEDLRILWQKQWEPWTKILCNLIPFDWQSVLDVDVDNARVTVNGILALTTLNVTNGTYKDLDVSGANVLFLDASSGDIILQGLKGGVKGQVLYIAVTVNCANDATCVHNSLLATQKLLLCDLNDETRVNELGGWMLVCDSTHWYDLSHAKHV